MLDILTFLKDNPYPDDDQFHAYAKSQGVDPDKAEAEAYKIISTFATGGKANEEGVTFKDVDPKELKMGIKVEYEHVDKKSTYAKLLAARIALDHLAEIDDYYTRLAKMEKEAGVEESMNHIREYILEFSIKSLFKRKKKEVKKKEVHTILGPPKKIDYPVTFKMGEAIFPVPTNWESLELQNPDNPKYPTFFLFNSKIKSKISKVVQDPKLKKAADQITALMSFYQKKDSKNCKFYVHKSSIVYKVLSKNIDASTVDISNLSL